MGVQCYPGVWEENRKQRNSGQQKKGTIKKAQCFREVNNINDNYSEKLTLQFLN